MNECVHVALGMRWKFNWDLTKRIASLFHHQLQWMSVNCQLYWCFCQRWWSCFSEWWLWSLHWEAFVKMFIIYAVPVIDVKTTVHPKIQTSWIFPYNESECGWELSSSKKHYKSDGPSDGPSGRHSRPKIFEKDNLTLSYWFDYMSLMVYFLFSNILWSCSG